jgi:phosphoribosylglycinamide formyltransferase-1
VPVADGLQPLMIEESPDVYFHPPYVGTSGWVGIVLEQIADDALESHLREARRIIAATRTPARTRRGRATAMP